MSDRKAAASSQIETTDGNGVVVFFGEGTSFPSSPSIPGQDVLVSSQAVACPTPRFLFGIDAPSLSHAQCLRLTSVNDGLAGLGEQVAEALRLCRDVNCIAVGSQGAGTAMEREYFRKVATQWLNGGAFPALGLTALELDAHGTMHSVGLRGLMNWEIAVPASAGLSRAEQAKAAIRFIDEMIRNGPPHHNGKVQIEGLGVFTVQIAKNPNLVYLLR